MQLCKCGSSAVEIAYNEKRGIVYCLDCGNESLYHNHHEVHAFGNKWENTTNHFFVFTGNHQHVNQQVRKIWDFQQDYRPPKKATGD